MKEIKVKITFKEEVLGTANSDKDIHEEYIASKAPDAPSKKEEVEALGVEEVVLKGKTIFPRDDEGRPMLWDYQVKGFFKSAASAGSYIGGDHKLANYKKKIDLLVFVNERKIPLILPEGAEMGDCQRPLRAQTMQGERVALANSETCPAGTTATFTVRVLDDGLLPFVRQWLDYGQYNGFGAWRNSSKGSFMWEEV